MNRVIPGNVDEYIAQAPEAGREKLTELRRILKQAAPAAQETLKWGKPVLVSDRILFAFSAHKSHLTFVPTGPALEPFRAELINYECRQDSVRFPYDKALPTDLITRIAEWRIRDAGENDAKWRY